MSSEKLVVENLFKVFGNHPERAFDLIEKGKGKDEIYKETGLTVGVHDASFEVKAGETFVVMGLSGSGKSTLVRMLNRLIEPTRGKVFLGDREVTAMNDKQLVEMRRRNMCMVFQSFALMPHLTVLQNVAFGLEVAGISRAEQEKRAQAALEQVGLGPYGNSMPSELSGGMQQRVGLARGLAVDPTIMLMDEAFSALDPLIRSEMQDELLRLQAESDRTVIFISHDLDEAMRIGDRIAIMESGKIVQVGTPDDILKNPADDYVRAFFRGVDPTSVLSAGDICRDNQVTFARRQDVGPLAALHRLNEHDREFGYVLDSQRKLKGVVSTESLRQLLDKPEPEHRLENAFIEGPHTYEAKQPLQEILDDLINSPWPLPVTDRNGSYKGCISKNVFLRTLSRQAEEIEEAAEQQKEKSEA
ncbi:glycine betaine/L-proline ABC transporter ATP-binding protein ProV [Desulfohalovibrio reitneri]|uniref:glycine betaine/L-proline ABC transporter ATP-binding protein ProV n=1 Tax=Desulfohalovibrio reitneri TaxID=1307759 RepID=UPI0004A75143|nr:glycine betaine/L-proline ABC transporter ATP-binding protein ProV [Desulfohalovibrio reitneri]